jgi:hypothetical protein
MTETRNKLELSPVDLQMHLKKIGRRGRLTIWVVDGNFVRSQIDREFTNFGQHFRFPFIPQDELWIDVEQNPDERRFFIDHLLTEWRLMRAGKPYGEATDAGQAKEVSERKKAGDLARLSNQQGQLEAERVHLRLLGTAAGKVAVWLINGRLVRSGFYDDFTEGGHDLVYRFVPVNEVWLDNDLVPQERELVLLHELYERRLMSRGTGYQEAHRKASRLEWQNRHGPERLAGSLKHLGWEPAQKLS